MRIWVFVSAILRLLLPFDLKKGHAQATLSLPSFPLAVKNPWLSAWLPGSAIANVAASQAQFWTGAELNWPILARVDGEAFVLFGNPEGLPANVKTATTRNVSYSSTHTYLTVNANEVDFLLDFFSPVWPKTEDFALQSLPYSYLTVNATVSGIHEPNGRKSIQIMSAIDQTWTAQEGASRLTYVETGKLSYFQFYNEDEVPYTENGSNDFNGLHGTNQATWGKVIFATAADGAGTTFECGNANKTYSTFVWQGKYSNSTSSCSATALAAISKDLSSHEFAGWQHDKGWSRAGVTFAIGHEREKSVNYLDTDFTGYHRTRWPQVREAVAFFLQNYAPALAASLSLDAAIRSQTESVSSEFGSQYADICEASVRQSYGSMELAIPADDLTGEPWIFLKEISSDGNMNTVDLIYQSWPIFINLNPKWIILQLVPILEYQKSGRWPQPYVIHDIGARYPNATGHDDGKDESMPLFETSALLILVHTYEKFAGDTTYTQRYASLWPAWADYLATNGLYPKSQLISVDAIPASPNQTALAMQAAIGLKAAAKLTGNHSYAETAESWVRTIYDDGLGLDGFSPADSTHFTYNYGSDDSWNVLFAAYSDTLLNLTTFPPEAWEIQSKWYLSQIDTAGLAFAGPASDKSVTWGLTDWNIMTAAAMSEELQQAVVSTTHAFMTNGKNDVPFGTKYYVTGLEAGVWIANVARGTVGTHFAISAARQGLWSY